MAAPPPNLPTFPGSSGTDSIRRPLGGGTPGGGVDAPDPFGGSAQVMGSPRPAAAPLANPSPMAVPTPAAKPFEGTQGKPPLAPPVPEPSPLAPPAFRQ